MTGTDSIISVIFDNLARLLPVRVIYNYQEGVRWTFGRPGRTKRGGWLWFMPFIQSVSAEDMRDRVFNTGEQTVRDKNELVTFRAVVRWRVYSAKQFACRLVDDQEEEAVDIIAAVVQGALLRHFNKPVKVIEQINKTVHTWGVAIEDLSLTDFAPTTAYRVYGVAGEV